MKRRHFLGALGLLGGIPLRPACAGARQPDSDRGAAAHELFEQYERRFAEARLRMPSRDPARAEDREVIAQVVKTGLGIRDEWVPEIRAERVREAAFDGGRIEMLRSASWPGVVGTALLYTPASAGNELLPLVVLCCGHGKGGKLHAGYQRMARHVARRGAMVLCPDNIGQGEREPMGHAHCVAPFACGLSVQGLIVMETLGWLAWARRQARVDRRRMAAVGNSGGGKLTLLLAPLCPELAALSSSGQPGTFEFVARKEKRICHCAVLPGLLGRVEMWHLLGAFAPRPMFIFQGESDPLFPADLFFHAARKVRHVYRTLGAEEAFQARVLPGGHSWDPERNRAAGDFLAQALKLSNPSAGESEKERLLSSEDRCLERWPERAVDTDALAQRLSGRRVKPGLNLWDVFPPPGGPHDLPEDVAFRGPTRQILAQFEAFLSGPAARLPGGSCRGF